MMSNTNCYLDHIRSVTLCVIKMSILHSFVPHFLFPGNDNNFTSFYLQTKNSK